MNNKEIETLTSLPIKYKFGNYIFNVKREFAEGGSTILEQTVTMLLDEMEKRKENNNGNGTK